MALERKLGAIGPLLFTADGTAQGIITVADTVHLKVKHRVSLSATSLPTQLVQVKRVLSKTQLIVGPNDNKISKNNFLDISAYTVGLGASISAEEQEKSNIPKDDHYVAIWEADPTNADRVTHVDPYGDFYTVSNPFPVQLSDGNINIENLNANVQVQISAKDNDPNAGDVHDSVRIGDGLNELKVNPDGSINTVSTQAPLTPQIVNFSALLANNEYSYTFPAKTVKFEMAIRDGAARMQVAYNPGESSTNYRTIYTGASYKEEGLTNNLSVYFQTNRANKIIEITFWKQS